MAVGTADYTMKNLNEKTNEEIEGFLKKSKEELFNLRFQSATGQLENTARLKACLLYTSKYPITDYALTPSVAIVDPVLARTQPRKLASDAGFDALTHSFEAYVSVYANDFTDGMALHAAKLIWDNLAESVNGEPGEDKIKAQEKMHLSLIHI